MPEGEGRWLPVEVDDLSVDDRVRVTHRRQRNEVYEGVVAAPPTYEGVVRVRHPGCDTEVGECFHPRYRTFERWVPNETESTEPEPEPLPFAAPVVGERFNRTYGRDGRPPRRNCEVVRVAPRAFGEGGWTVRYAHDGQPHYTVDVNPDGTLSAFSGGRFERPAPAAPLVTPEEIARNVRVAEAPLPGWATSLDAARRYVHEVAWDLEGKGSNCTGGTTDFLASADLPEEREWPETDESAEIRAFLFKVREAALSTASDHGKSLRQVEEWLTLHGITAPAPAETQHTVTFTAPAGADVAQALRDLGWTVQVWEKGK